MAVFSTNQNNLFYVTKSSSTVGLTTNLGDIKVAGVADKYIYFNQKGLGGIVRSEIIPIDCITYAHATKASDLKTKLKLVTVALDENVNEGAPIAGEDYVLRINFRQAYTMSDEDIYQKYGAVHALANMTAGQFYVRMINSLLKNFNHLYTPVVTIKAATAVTDGIATASTEVAKVVKSGSTYKAYDTAGTEITDTTILGIVIEEKSLEGEWALGVKNLQTVQFDVVPTEVFDDGDLVQWGVIGETEIDGLDNGYRVAEMEYFYMGERADLYRNIGWPNVIPTKYMADETGAYTMVNIHFHFAGEGLQVHKSEKDITIAFATLALATAFITAFNALITVDTAKLINTLA